MIRGMLYIHSAPRALAPHIEWAASGVIGAPCRLRWEDQPAERGLVRAESGWGCRDERAGADLATVLRGWDHLRFEITQDAGPHGTGSRWSYTPELGIHFTPIDEAGNSLIPEDRIRWALDEAGHDPILLRQRIDAALGAPWDDELELFRHAGDGDPVRWLHAVG